MSGERLKDHWSSGFISKSQNFGIPSKHYFIPLIVNITEMKCIFPKSKQENQAGINREGMNFGIQILEHFISGGCHTQH